MIRNVCIVDDDVNKQKIIADYLARLLPDAEMKFFNCASQFLLFTTHRCSGEILTYPEEWLIVLGMQMPFMIGERIWPDEGWYILGELMRKNFKCPVIIVSSDFSDDARASEYAGYLGSIEFDVVHDLTEKFRTLLENVKEG